MEKDSSFAALISLLGHLPSKNHAFLLHEPKLLGWSKPCCISMRTSGLMGQAQKGSPAPLRPGSCIKSWEGATLEQAGRELCTWGTGALPELRDCQNMSSSTFCILTRVYGLQLVCHPHGCWGVAVPSVHWGLQLCLWIDIWIHSSALHMHSTAEGNKFTASWGRSSFHCQCFANFLQAQGSEAVSGFLKLETCGD